MQCHHVLRVKNKCFVLIFPYSWRNKYVICDIRIWWSEYWTSRTNTDFLREDNRCFCTQAGIANENSICWDLSHMVLGSIYVQISGSCWNPRRKDLNSSILERKLYAYVIVILIWLGFAIAMEVHHFIRFLLFFVTWPKAIYRSCSDGPCVLLFFSREPKVFNCGIKMIISSSGWNKNKQRAEEQQQKVTELLSAASNRSPFEWECFSTMVWSKAGGCCFYWNHILQTEAHVSFSSSSSSSSPLSKVRHHWMSFYLCGNALHKQPWLVEGTLY